MAGGAGTRFWPLSRRRLPKQLLPLNGTRTMVAETAARVSGIVPTENVMAVTGSLLRKPIAAALPGVPARNILCEPVGRNTAACVAWAAIEIHRREPDAVMVVLPADHIVDPIDRFVTDVCHALALADSRRCLVTFGIQPDAPATGYGYLQAGPPLPDALPGSGACKVDAFLEKPDLARAKELIAAPGCYWNSGMFAWRADVVLEEFARHLPDLLAALREMDGRRKRGRIPQATVDAAYPGLPSISIDKGVLERSDRVAMIPAGFRWSDIGGWNAVAELWPADANGNRSRDPLVAVDAAGNVVATRGKPVALLGVQDLAIVDSGDALLVCRRDLAEEVRRVVAELEPAGLGRLL
jgi:mannose-1-phosphate guanylyltransferase